MNKNSSLLILGANGLVGSALVRSFQEAGYKHLLTPSRQELDLFSAQHTLEYFRAKKPQMVIVAAARVGGIHANNTLRADFITENLKIALNSMEAAHLTEVKKLLFLGSSCIYPVDCPRPIKEEYLLTGKLEPTNEPYALSKIAGIKMAESYRRQYGRSFFSAMPTNIFGPYDNFHPTYSHVIPGLIQRMQQCIDEKREAFSIWGTGSPKREFLYSEDLADGCRFLMEHSFNGIENLPSLINIGSNKEISIKEIAIMLKELMGFKGDLVFDENYPDGVMSKMMDSSKLFDLGWRPKTSLRDGLKKTITFFREHQTELLQTGRLTGQLK